MNDYLCILRPAREGFVDAPTDDEVAAVRAHFAYLQGLTAAGVCRLAGRPDAMGTVSYTHLTLPRNREVRSLEVAVTLTKKK